MVFWELKPHFHSYLLAEKNYIMFSTGTCLLLVCEASWQSEQENSKPNGSGICLGLVGRWRGYSWLSVSETEIICSVQCLQGHLVLSPSCALLWVTDPNFNVLLHKSTYPLERCCKIEVDSSAGTNKQMFLLNMHRETNCSHNPTGPPREIEVFIPFAPEAASTAHHWLLQMGDQIQPFTVQGPVAFFTQLSWCHIPRRTGSDSTFSGNGIAVPAVPCYWWDVTRLISHFRLCREPPQPTLGTGLGTVPCAPPSTRLMSSGTGITC